MERLRVCPNAVFKVSGIEVVSQSFHQGPNSLPVWLLQPWDIVDRNSIIMDDIDGSYSARCDTLAAEIFCSSAIAGQSLWRSAWLPRSTARITATPSTVSIQEITMLIDIGMSGHSTNFFPIITSKISSDISHIDPIHHNFHSSTRVVNPTATSVATSVAQLPLPLCPKLVWTAPMCL